MTGNYKLYLVKNLTKGDINVSERTQISSWQIDHCNVFEVVFGKLGKSAIDLVSKLDILQARVLNSMSNGDKLKYLELLPPLNYIQA